jgi:photosystem II stability/assembly factor-like uncharacterized protein
MAGFRAIQAVDAHVVWIAGPGGAWRTVDGGQSWQARAIPGAERLDFRGIAAFDPQTAVLLSAGPAEEGRARIYRTADAGGTWQQVFETQEPGVFLDGLAFWDEHNGLAFGDPVEGKWYLLRTRDGGRTWQRIPPDNLPPMLPQEAAFAASNSSMILQGRAGALIASGGARSARVFISTDSGEHWKTVDTPMPAGVEAGIFGLRFWDSRHGIGVGGAVKREHEASDNVILTSDGGHRWRKGAPTEPPGLKEAVTRLPDGALLAVGPSGTGISHDLGRSWTQVDTLRLHALACAQDQCWSVGGGLVAKWHP